MPRLRFADRSEISIPVWLVPSAKSPPPSRRRGGLPTPPSREALAFAAATSFDAKPGRCFFFTPGRRARGGLLPRRGPGRRSIPTRPAGDAIAARRLPVRRVTRQTRTRRPGLPARRPAVQPLQEPARKRPAGRAGGDRRRRPSKPWPRCVALARALIDTPANDMGPDELEAAVLGVAAEDSARRRRLSGATSSRGNFR